MKGIRNLLLLLLAIISQGAWAVGEPELNIGVNSISCAAFPTYSENDEDPSNYLIYHFVAPCTGKLVIDDVSEIRTPASIALFDANKQYMRVFVQDFEIGHQDERTDNYLSLRMDVVKGNNYYVGFRATPGEVALVNEKFKVDVYCTEHQLDETGKCTTEGCTLQEQVLRTGVNTVDIIKYDHNLDGMYQYFTFVAPCDGDLLVTDVTGGGSRLEMYLKETGNCSSDDVPTYMYVQELVKGNVYQIGLRDYSGEALQNVQIRIDMDCLNHNIDENGICQNEGCTKQLRKLTEGLNEEVDCSYYSDQYLFIPEESGKLTLIAKNNGEERFIYYTLFDEKKNVVFTNYVASAPKRKAAGGSGGIVEAGHKYFLDFTNNHMGVYDIVIGVREVIPPVELSDTQINEVSFPVGYEQLSGFKYTANERGGLTVSIDTDAEIVWADIIPWDDWLQIEESMDGGSPASAPRKVAGFGGNEPLVLSQIVEPGEYAIFIVTTTNEETSAEITVNLATVGTKTLALGSNWVEVAANDIEDWVPESEDFYTIFPFTPNKSGVLTVESNGDEFIILALFDEDDNFMKFASDWELSLSAVVDANKTYKVGIHYGNPIALRLVNVSIKDLPQINKTLELYSEEEGEIAFGNALNSYWGEDSWEDIFSANGVTYKRNATSSKWGTVVLPYELKSNGKVAYYELTAADIPGGNLKFTKVDVVKPNTPTVYRILDGNQYDASIDGEVLIETPQDFGNIWGATKADGWSMEGWYYGTTINTQADYILYMNLGFMYISGDKFYHATGTVTVKPYRAIFEAYDVDWSSAPAKALTILFKDGDDVDCIESIMEENGEFTDVEAVYSIDGQRMNGIQRGVNIIRTADGKTRKFIKK